MTIEFTCGHCGKSLSTSDDKAGRKAKCPGCGEAIEVPRVNTDGVELSTTVPVVAPSQRRSTVRKCPMCGHSAAPDDENCTACGEPLGQETRKVRDAPAGEPVAFDLGTVLSRSWQIFKQDMALVIGGQLVAGLLSGAAFIPAIGLAIAGVVLIDQAGNDIPAAAIVMFGAAGFLLLIGMVVGLWLVIGVQMLLLGLVRGRDVSFGTLFEGKRYLGRFFLCSIIYNIMVQIGSQMCVIPGLLVFLFFWPFQYLLIDEDRPNIQAFLDAPKLASKSWLMTIVLVIVSFGINLLGLLALIVGLFFTGPYVNLAWCVAYDEMRGAADDDDLVDQHIDQDRVQE
ncbi:MAG: hypothetical protein B7Z55_02315 [Planctomycetales bacterium 12-60-4]|nr:MAG: hypothetical protein B7Z55_02315 [Planctomycetales bacterium 12-60-4]